MADCAGNDVSCFATVDLCMPSPSPSLALKRTRALSDVKLVVITVVPICLVAALSVIIFALVALKNRLDLSDDSRMVLLCSVCSARWCL